MKLKKHISLPKGMHLAQNSYGQTHSSDSWASLHCHTQCYYFRHLQV